jgi:hypothetical protein
MHMHTNQTAVYSLLDESEQGIYQCMLAAKEHVEAPTPRVHRGSKDCMRSKRLMRETKSSKTQNKLSGRERLTLVRIVHMPLFMMRRRVLRRASN